MFLVYDIIFICFAILYLPFFLIRLQMAESKKRLLLDRFGILPKEFKHEESKVRLWLHAVSVGEAMATKKLVQELYEKFPNLTLYYSTVTPTGYKVAKELFPESIRLFYFPFDISWITNRVIRFLKPHLIILMETEIWPNLILSARMKRIPVCIVNGRFSPKSFRSYYRFKTLIRNVTRMIRFASVQNENFKRRFIRLGFNKERVFVTGTMKYDVFDEPSPDILSRAEWLDRIGFPSNAKIWIAASTHPQEEEICLDVFQRLGNSFPEIRLILAPRHIERAKQIAKLVQERKLILKLANPLGSLSSEEKPDVFLLNTLGELAKTYAYTDFVFMGGSLIPHGGQNPLEAVFWRRPVLFGPHTYNFSDVYNKIQQEGGGQVVQDEEDLYQALFFWAKERDQVKEMGEKAFDALESLKGASRKNCDLIMAELGRK